MLNKLNTILTDTITGLGFELVDIEISPARIITVYIDKPNGITIENCEEVSKHLSKLFLVEEITYNRLEVSSPGLDRPLKKLADFTKSIGCTVKIKTKELIDNVKVFIGTIQDVNGDDITLKLENETNMVFNFNNIYKARLIFELKKNTKIKKK